MRYGEGVGGGGGYFLISPIKRRAAGQGMVFGLFCREQGITLM